jgi:hypothetical protein
MFIYVSRLISILCASATVVHNFALVLDVPNGCMCNIFFQVKPPKKRGLLEWDGRLLIGGWSYAWLKVPA